MSRPRPGPAAGRDRILVAIAIFKFCKATLLAVIGFGALQLLRPEFVDHARAALSALSSGVGRNAAQDLLARATGMSHGRIEAVGAAAFLYAAIFTVEGVGLWREKHWAEYLTVIVTVSFVPFEIYELVQRPSLAKVSAILINLLVVAYLVERLRRRRQALRP
jgi:uncharacterized membrane protein (DUF2068 family)